MSIELLGAFLCRHAAVKDGTLLIDRPVGMLTGKAGVRGPLALQPLYVVLLLAGQYEGPFSVSMVMRGPESQSRVLQLPTDPWPKGAWAHRVLALLEPEVEYTGSALYRLAFLLNNEPLVTLVIPIVEEGHYIDPNLPQP